MRKIEEVIQDIKYGNILTIVKCDTINEDSYSACFTEYDGKILVDVKELVLGNFLDQIPNIKSKLNGSDYYQVKYDFEKQVYQSAIMHKVTQQGYKELFVSEILDDLTTENSSLIDGMIDLDTEIAQKITNPKELSKKKELVS